MSNEAIVSAITAIISLFQPLLMDIIKNLITIHIVNIEAKKAVNTLVSLGLGVLIAWLASLMLSANLSFATIVAIGTGGFAFSQISYRATKNGKKKE